MSEVIYVRYDGTNEDFIENCRLPDEDLDRRVGRVIKRDKYKQYNQLEEIREAIVVYNEGKLIGAGALRPYDDTTIELKKVFVRPDYQGKGVGTALVSQLIEWAKELGFHEITNYIPYVNMPESFCMGKELADNETNPVFVRGSNYESNV